MKDVLLAIDAGGTNFKYALMSMNGEFVSESMQTPVNEKGSAEEIEASWRGVSQTAAEAAKRLDVRVTCVCVSTPGPFDFAGGKSKMKHKFAAIEGLEIRPWIRSALGDVPVDFLHDSTAFILGEVREGMKSPACVMLGTGFGFACMREGQVLVNATRTPAVILWNAPFRGGIVEDSISRRALRALYKDGSTDVKEIADLARSGDEEAKAVFEKLAEAMGELLADILAKLGCDCLILGGQISGAADLFVPQLSRLLPCPVVLSERPQSAALVGAARFAAACGQAEKTCTEPLI